MVGELGETSCTPPHLGTPIRLDPAQHRIGRVHVSSTGWEADGSIALHMVIDERQRDKSVAGRREEGSGCHHPRLAGHVVGAVASGGSQLRMGGPRAAAKWCNDKFRANLTLPSPKGKKPHATSRL